MILSELLHKIMKDGKTSYEAEPQVLVDKMASTEAINLMMASLKENK